MDPRVKRILITLIVIAASVSIIAVVLTSRPPKSSSPPAIANTPAAASPTGTDESTTPVDELATAESATNDTDNAAKSADTTSDTNGDIASQPETETNTSDGSAVDLAGLIAHAPTARDADTPELATIGSLDPASNRFKVELTSRGAAVSRITFSDIWDHASVRREALAHEKAVANGRPNPPPLPPDSTRLVLAQQQRISANDELPVLSAHSIVINGTAVNLFDFNADADGTKSPIWSLTGDGQYETEITNAAGQPVLRILRTWVLAEHSYDLQLQQQIVNLTNHVLKIQWLQWGPPQLEPTGAPYIDPRRFRFGHMLSKQKDPQRLAEVSPATDMMLALATVAKQYDKAQTLLQNTPAGTKEYNDLLTLWPTDKVRSEQFELSWFASTNRYFALAIHPYYTGTGPVNRSLESFVSDIKDQHFTHTSAANSSYVCSFITSPVHTLQANSTADFNLGVYAGPMDRAVLSAREPYRALNLGGLIVYQMSSFCGMCTFQWLAHILIWFLTAAHSVVLDWGISIVLLVFVVRLLLHPITKRAQVSMHTTMRRMSKFKPEMEKLQKKYAGDKKKLQVEQVKLMREHGVNPLGCLGFLPMLLQMPIWIALYAMLFFAYELRQEPAFWGFFQMFGDWGFLADLSQADHFLGEFATPIHPFGFKFFTMTGINILPAIMGIVMFVQQKYMTPPTAATMSPEQQKQQRIMRVMMIFLFPVMLYNAPSGLTMYIMTSSTMGIIESRMIRKHAERLEEEREKNPNQRMDSPPWGEKDKKRKSRDPRGRAYAQMLERMRENKKEQRSFKKRRKDQ